MNTSWKKTFVLGLVFSAAVGEAKNIAIYRPDLEESFPYVKNGTPTFGRLAGDLKADTILTKVVNDSQQFCKHLADSIKDTCNNGAKDNQIFFIGHGIAGDKSTCGPDLGSFTLTAGFLGLCSGVLDAVKNCNQGAPVNVTFMSCNTGQCKELLDLFKNALPPGSKITASSEKINFFGNIFRDDLRENKCGVVAKWDTVVEAPPLPPGTAPAPVPPPPPRVEVQVVPVAAPPPEGQMVCFCNVVCNGIHITSSRYHGFFFVEPRELCDANKEHHRKKANETCSDNVRSHTCDWVPAPK